MARLPLPHRHDGHQKQLDQVVSGSDEESRDAEHRYRRGLDRVRTEMQEPRDLSVAETLVVRAFDAARATGRSDWDSMTAAVLKNRMLQLTARSFDEHEFGFERFGDLLDHMPNLVDVDRTTTPPTVTFTADRSALAVPQVEGPGRGARIRPDLWHAVVDYASGSSWVWDAAAGSARVGTDGVGLVRIPTMTLDEMADVRRGFVGRCLAAGDRPDAERLKEWAADGLGNFVLAADVRHDWNAFLKDDVLRRLRTFFQQTGQSMPGDALQGTAGPLYQRSRSGDDVDRLREMVGNVVRSMTTAELMALPLPAAAVLRSQTRSTKARR